MLLAIQSSRIRIPEDGTPGNTIRVWSEATEGSKDKIMPGLGVVYPRTIMWTYLPWAT